MEDLERLYKTHYAAVVRFLYRKIWDADRAEDLAQEVFIRAMAHQPDKPRAWIFAVAANLARDEARAAIRRRKHLVLLKDDPVPLSTPELSADESVEHDERWAQVTGALAALTERDREVLLLWDAGLSYPEIAAQTGLAVGAVGTTLARARKRLTEAYDRTEYQADAARS
jgi:RNA polymerase sigma-70 factor (ECF subfamily)